MTLYMQHLDSIHEDICKLRAIVERRIRELKEKDTRDYNGEEL